MSEYRNPIPTVDIIIAVAPGRVYVVEGIYGEVQVFLTAP